MTELSCLGEKNTIVTVILRKINLYLDLKLNTN